MNFGSLFSGIGGLDLAMEACGHTAVWQVEMDAFCSSILETHWPDVQRYTDIRDIDWNTVPRPELICGGFPCQPFSVAGENRGEDDKRNLWPETIRAVRELRPDYVFLENVPGLLAHGYFGRILGDLAEGGYDAVWDTFTAAEVGAPHRRERLFILAYARCWVEGEHGNSEQVVDGRSLPETKWPSVRDSAGRPSRDVAYTRQQHEHVQQSPSGLHEPTREGVRVADAKGSNRRSREPSVESTTGFRRRGLGGDDEAMADAAGSRQRTGLRDDDAGQPDTAGRFSPGPDERAAWARVLAEVPTLEPAVCRVVNGVPNRAHRLRALGNAVVPVQGAYAFGVLWDRKEQAS